MLYSTGEKGRNRVRLDAHPASRVLRLNWLEDGRARTRSLGHRDVSRGKAEADALAAALATRRPTRGEPLTLAALFDIYDRERGPTVSTSRRTVARAVGERMAAFFGPTLRCDALTERRVAAYIQHRLALGPLHATAPGAPLTTRTVRAELGVLRAALRLAVDMGRLDRHPVPSKWLPPENTPRRPLLTAADFDALVAVADEVDPALRPLLIVGRETGRRIGALLALRWSDCDLDAGLVRWRREADKQGVESVVPLSEVAVATLRAWQRRSGGIGEAPVFHTGRGSTPAMRREHARDLWYELERRAGLPRVRGRGWHALRRLFANELRAVPLKDLMLLGGWRDPETVVKVYQTATEATMRAALAQRQRLEA